MNAWIADEYDVIVQTADAFPLYTAPDEFETIQSTCFHASGLVERWRCSCINSINDLKGKKVAVAVPSPAQTLLITALEAAGLKYSDVEVISNLRQYYGGTNSERGCRRCSSLES